MEKRLLLGLSKNQLFGAILILGTLLIYAPSLFFQFLYYDDNLYVFENLPIQSGFTADFFKWVLTANVSSNWHPLTLVLHTLDWQLYGNWAGGHHLTSVILHAINALLVFLLFLRMTNSAGKSFLLAAFFAWHPVKVESVAWVAERKDVLSTLFALLAIHVYVRSIKSNSKLTLAALTSSLALFACSLMSKPMYVTLPLILFLFDFWPLARNDKTIYFKIIEKIPFCVLSAASCWVTLQYQSASGSVHHFADAAPWIRIATLAQAYWDYIALFFWPSKLSIFYPYIPIPHPLASAVLGFFLVLFTGWLWTQRKKIAAVWIGWLIFITGLLPVIGIVNVGAHWIACRYLYWPSTGLAIMAVWGIESVIIKFNLQKKMVLILGILGIAIYTLIGSNYLSHWQNTFTLFNYCLKNEPNAWALHANLHTAYGREGKHEEAAAHLIQAIGILPEYENRAKLIWFDYFMMGKVFWMHGETQQAVNRFKKAKHILDSIPDNLLAAETLSERTQLNNCLAADNSKNLNECKF